MPEIVFLPFIIAGLLAPPFMSAIYARNIGRSYGFWFFMGCILPIIASIILLFLPDKPKPE